MPGAWPLTTIALLIFLVVYVGMVLGGLPGLALDRSGVALLGAILMLVTGVLTPQGAWTSVDIGTIGLLFGLMVVSVQLRLGGFYSWATRHATAAHLDPPALLGIVILLCGALSAVLANDIVCLAVTPVLIDITRRRHLDPVPFLLALACASNVDSAATLIGNPQNILIGQTLRLGFTRFLLTALPPALAGLGIVWLVIVVQQRGAWQSGPAAGPVSGPEIPEPIFDRWQSSKGLGVVTIVMILLLFTPIPREIIALGAAAALLTSRRMESRETIALVDWHLIVLFIGLFIVNAGIQASGYPTRVIDALAGAGFDPGMPVPLFLSAAVLSNLVSNVPAVMLLLPVATHPASGPILALSSTLAGNLLLIGSIANLIVVSGASLHGITIGWSRHARTGLPVGIFTLLIAAAWLAVTT